MTLADASRCIHFLGPLHAVRAEANFLAGNPAGSMAEARAAYDLAVERGHPRYTGELAYWRWKVVRSGAAPLTFSSLLPCKSPGIGRLPPGPGTISVARTKRREPWPKGADETALRAALATCERLGAKPAAALARGRLRESGARGIPRGPRPSTRANAVGLTAREVDVVGAPGPRLQQSDRLPIASFSRRERSRTTSRRFWPSSVRPPARKPRLGQSNSRSFPNLSNPSPQSEYLPRCVCASAPADWMDRTHTSPGSRPLPSIQEPLSGCRWPCRTETDGPLAATPRRLYPAREIGAPRGRLAIRRICSRFRQVTTRCAEDPPGRSRGWDCRRPGA